MKIERTGNSEPQRKGHAQRVLTVHEAWDCEAFTDREKLKAEVERVIAEKLRNFATMVEDLQAKLDPPPA